MYIDGKPYSTVNLKNTAFYVNGTYRNPTAIALYIFGSGYKDSEFEIFDTYIDIISNATLEDVQNRIGKLILRK